MVKVSSLGVVTLFVALLGVAKAWSWGVSADEGKGLRPASRELQGGIFTLCGTAFENGRKSHLLANLNARGKSIQDWVPVPTENFNVVVDQADGLLTLFGQVIPKGARNLNNVMTVSFTYSLPVGIDQCYCASPYFLLLGDPNIYDRIEDHCNLENYQNRPDEAESLLFCPTCEDNQCKIASRNENAPDPVFADWTFYEQVGGSLSGPGLELFFRKVEQGFRSFDINTDFAQCTPDIANQPLPQLHCSDYSDPDDSFGWGVNGKNQNCGFSTWFNCEELDLPPGVHIADINLDLIECIFPFFPPPTAAPTGEPTEGPTAIPTEAPTQFPTDFPTVGPTPAPTDFPTVAPTERPTTPAPTTFPTVDPTVGPTVEPTEGPTTEPSVSPTVAPTPCPVMRCKVVEVCVPCKYFPDDMNCGMNMNGFD